MSKIKKIPEKQLEASESNFAPFEQELKKINPQILNGIPLPKQKELIRAIVSITKNHSGPLPDVETLHGYSELIPEGAERVMKMAEEQAKHRQSIEKTVIESQMKQSGRGQIFAFAIGMFAITMSAVCILLDKGWPGAILGVGGITGLVTAFIQGRKSDSTNRAGKT